MPAIRWSRTLKNAPYLNKSTVRCKIWASLENYSKKRIGDVWQILASRLKQ